MVGPKKATGYGPVWSGVVVQFGAVRSDLDQSGLVWSDVRPGPDPWIKPRWRTSPECLCFLGSLEQLHNLTLSIRNTFVFLEQLHNFDK